MDTLRMLLVTSLLCVSAILADQPPYPLQLFYLSPNNVGILPPSQPAMSYIAKSVEKSVPQDEMVEGEASQFHSQDSRGRALFGYTTPDQARIEARNEDGTVRGSYSYLDAWGKAVKVQYWDDGSGFHAAGNNLPGVYADIPQPVQDTPEVMAAKEQHFQLFQQALAAAVASTEEKEIQKPVETKPEVEKEPEHDGVIVESDEPNHPVDEDSHELTRYPDLHKFPQNLYDPTQVHDANREAVIVDNPDISPELFGNSLRSGKTLQVKTVPTVADLEMPKVPAGFFYSFKYPVPMYVQVRTVEEEEADNKKQIVPKVQALSASHKASLFGAVPVAAVHDVQVPPYLKNSVKNYQIMPLYVETPARK